MLDLSSAHQARARQNSTLLISTYISTLQLNSRYSVDKQGGTKPGLRFQTEDRLVMADNGRSKRRSSGDTFYNILPFTRG